MRIQNWMPSIGQEAILQGSVASQKGGGSFITSLFCGSDCCRKSGGDEVADQAEAPVVYPKPEKEVEVPTVKMLQTGAREGPSGQKDGQRSLGNIKYEDLLHAAETDPNSSLLNGNITALDDAWYGQQLLRLQRDGVSCTYVDTDGTPYERTLYVDPRNFTLEIRGGRTGATGVLLDDLIDVRRGPSSPDFEQFCMRFENDTPPSDFVERALVLWTPRRTFSFLLPTVTHRGTVACCILFLLKLKDRGVMAVGEEYASHTLGPKEGFGSVIYPNHYEGHFHNYMRHGFGTLTLSDGTKYESQWRQDVRHGDGRELWPDGSTFTGSYMNGMRHGHGVMSWPEGSKYVGQFERGLANGEGELLGTDYSVYRGQFSEDCMSGEGRMQWRDGDEYVGQFVGNRREGFGRMHWASGEWKRYEGYWKDGLQHGEGTLIDHDSQEFCGAFRDGQMDRWNDDV